MELRLKNSDFVALVDDGDSWKVDGIEWRLNKNNRGGSYVASCSKVGAASAYGYVLLHRHLLQAARGEIVDHRNGDALDNRRSNIRICSHAENMRNRKVGKNSSSGIRNVQDAGVAWAAEVKMNGKKFRKRFPKTERGLECAVEWATKMRLELHGEFSADHGVLA